MSGSLKRAKDAQKGYRWVKKLVATAYDIPMGKKKKGKGRYAKSLWDWERYALNLKNAKPLTDNLLENAS